MTKRITLKTLRSMYAKGEPISMVTAYDYPSAVHVSLHTNSGSHVSKRWCFSERTASCLLCKMGTFCPCLFVVCSLQQARQCGQLDMACS